MAIYLKNLYLGSADGDTESNKKEFLELFYTGNNKYAEITNEPLKYIIYGRKGTGKTILGRYIEKKYNAKGVVSKIINKDDITLAKMIEKNNEILSIKEAGLFFKWIVYYQIFKIIEDINLNYPFKLNKQFLIEYKKIKSYKKAIKDLKSIFNDRYKKENFEFHEFVAEEELQRGAEITAEKKGILDSKISEQTKKGRKATYIKSEFFNLLDEVEKNILICLKAVSVVLIFDDLDELDIDLADETGAMTAINKLIEALKNINMIFANNELTPTKCILLIRSDIIEELNKRSTNLNKIIQDNAVELYWIDKENKKPESHPLMEMILTKVKTSCSEYKDLSNKQIYDKLFPELIGGVNAVSFLINQGFGRPRDIINYLEIIRRKYPNEICFRATMFKECKQAYSQAFLNELYNEMVIHIENDKIDGYIQLLRDYGQNSFYPNQIKAYYKRHRKNYKISININEFIETLYKFGAVGNMWSVKKGGKDKKAYSWAYRKNGNQNVNLEQRCSVHYGLRKILNLQ